MSSTPRLILMSMGVSERTREGAEKRGFSKLCTYKEHVFLSGPLRPRISRTEADMDLGVADLGS